MEIKKEGLYTYGIVSSVQNEYFLLVEYPLLRHNQPSTLLPVLIREQDGKATLMYNISDVRSLTEISCENKSHGNNFSKEDCRDFLKCLQCLLKELEELMLSPEHISFSPEHIFRAGNHAFLWMYCPDENYCMEKEVQNFFSWMLSEINYGDSETVRYVYQIYWFIRNRSFSDKLIQECLSYEEEPAGITAYESFFAQKPVHEGRNEEEEEKQKEKPFSEAGQDQCEGKKERFVVGAKMILWLEVVLGIASALTGVVVSASGIYALLYGKIPLYNRYWVTCVVLLLLLLKGTCQVHRKRKTKNNQRKAWGEAGRGMEEKEETVRLDTERKGAQPFLTNEFSGEHIPLYCFPFYIGNDRGLNQLAIHDNTVSRAHAVIERGESPGKYILRDLQSTNGTWVNELQVKGEVELKEGDLLQFATHRYRFE